MKKKYLLIFIIIAIGAVTALTLLKKPQKKIISPNSYKMKNDDKGQLYMEKEELDPDTEEYAYDPEIFQQTTSSKFQMIFPKSWMEWNDGTTIATISEDYYNNHKRGGQIPPEGEVIFKIYAIDFTGHNTIKMNETDNRLFEMKPGESLEFSFSTVTKIEDLIISDHPGIRTRTKYSFGGELAENMIVENVILRSLLYPKEVGFILQFSTDQKGYDKHKDEIEAMIDSFSTPESQLKGPLSF